MISFYISGLIFAGECPAPVKYHRVHQPSSNQSKANREKGEIKGSWFGSRVLYVHAHAHQLLKETRKTAKKPICRCELKVNEETKIGQTIQIQNTNIISSTLILWLFLGLWKVREDQILWETGLWRPSGRVHWWLPIDLRGPQVPGVQFLCGDGWCVGPLWAAQLPRTPVLPGPWRVPQLYRLGRHLPCCGILPHDQRVLEQQRPHRVLQPLKELFEC